MVSRSKLRDAVIGNPLRCVGTMRVVGFEDHVQLVPEETSKRCMDLRSPNPHIEQLLVIGMCFGFRKYKLMNLVLCFLLDSN